ncbi:MAG TPA: hypothetical protein VMV49_04380 [Candidatus Deferrimicrobium sp.]|nr:hypothetical protein [Candidatus Deferrimicrobium sp.]
MKKYKENSKFEVNININKKLIAIILACVITVSILVSLLCNNVTCETIALTANAIASLVNCSISDVNLFNNDTLYIENTTISSFITKLFEFFAGDIYGYNDTFVGQTSWQNGTIIEGPNCAYNIRYNYYVRNDVIFTVFNTYAINNYVLYNNANGSLINSSSVRVDTFTTSNATLIGSEIFTITGQGSSNVTLYNSTALIMSLSTSAFGSILDHSWINTLTLSGSADYYHSADSHIENPP